MKYRINWRDIKDSYRGFEALAVQYVQSNYNKNFKQTKNTRDGNKDAVLTKDEYTIVLGYSTFDKHPVEWWMEAKYSNTEEKISRYRLDATLVSAILKGSVDSIIFVTNVNISSLVINDIRQAITCAICCSNVTFITKDILEYWLYQNPVIMKLFFPYYNIENIDLPDIAITEQMELFDADVKFFSFREKLTFLEKNHKYKARFLVYSQKSQKQCIQTNNELQGITGIDPAEVNLKIGINEVFFSFMLSLDYDYKSNKRKDEHSKLPVPSFKFGGLDIVAKDSIIINKKIPNNYKLPSQQKLLQHLTDFYKNESHFNKLRMFCISGQSGVGKSHVIRLFIETCISPNTLCFFCDMTESQNTNLYLLVKCINFIYLPFIDTDSITIDYLRSIKSDNYLPKLYYELIESHNNIEKLGNLIVRYLSEDMRLFPQNLRVNPRVIIIDNIHKANEQIINTIYKMSLELLEQNSSFVFILSGQYVTPPRCFGENNNRIESKSENLHISTEDCASVLSDSNISKEVLSIFQKENMFSSMVELLFFSEYVHDINQKLEKKEDFQILYHQFITGGFQDEYIGRIFSTIKGDDVAEKLCNKIYWNPNGCSNSNLDGASKLLMNCIVKHDSSSNRLIPYHDLYTKYYRQRFINYEVLQIPFIQLFYNTNFSYNMIKDAISKLHKQFKSQNYIIVYYELEKIFTTNESIYKSLLSDDDYYFLYYDFARSCSHCSIEYSGTEFYKKIYNELQQMPQPSHNIRRISIGTLWELTNSTFESLEYKEANKYCLLLVKNLHSFNYYEINNSKVEDSVYFHNTNVILSMIKSELKEADSYRYFFSVVRKMLRSGNESRCWSYKVRYSLTLMQNSPKKAIKILKECCKHYDQSDDFSEKYRLWAHFYLSYMMMIYKSEAQEEEKALGYMNQLHDRYYNDYRKILIGISIYFYYKGETDKGDYFLLSDYYVLRKRRPRLKGFWHMANAVRDICINQYDDALSELEQSHEIFMNIPTYDEIIQHNIFLIQNNKHIKEDNIHYYFGGSKNKNYYYLDIRCCW